MEGIPMISFKSSIAVILVLAMVLSFGSVFAYPPYEAEPAYEANEVEMHGVTTASVLNVRGGPSTDYQILGQLRRGTYVNITAVLPGWVRIEFREGAAYLSTDFVMVRSGQMPARATSPSVRAQQVVDRAKQYLGVPYRWGGTTPAGFDCSGFMWYLYRQFGVQLNRVAHDQRRNGTPVARADLLPGDLVFFYPRAGATHVSHVGMYVGGGYMIHAPSTGNVVRFTSINSANRISRYAGARRIFHY